MVSRLTKLRYSAFNKNVLPSFDQLKVIVSTTLLRSQYRNSIGTHAIVEEICVSRTFNF